MFTNTNMAAHNNMPLNNEGLNKNANMYVGDNILEDPVIQEFINKIPGWFADGLYALKMITLTLLLHFIYGLMLCLFGLMVTTFWTLIQEWIEIICAVTSIATTAMFLKWIHDETDLTDQYIVKLKAELAAKDTIIAELKLVALSAAAENLDEDLDSEISGAEDDSDSDYDPDLDEY
jgi:hypothetical protein